MTSRMKDHLHLWSEDECCKKIFFKIRSLKDKEFVIFYFEFSIVLLPLLFIEVCMSVIIVGILVLSVATLEPSAPCLLI